MICPHCKKNIPETAVAAHLGAKGGAFSKRKITPAQQAKLQKARKEKRK
jgi:hypothetical protein